MEIQKSKSIIETIKINKESILSILASEEVLKKDWDNEADERWNDI